MFPEKQNERLESKNVHFFFILGITLIGLFLTGCAEVNHLHDAQSSLSQAARLENQLRISPAVGTQVNGLLMESEIRSGYAGAIASIDSLNGDQIENLKNHKLWGVALTIKAISYWRLGDYDKMREVSVQANEVKDQIYPRDRGLLLALPGLCRVDEAEAIVAAGIEGTEDEKRKIKAERLQSVKGLVKTAMESLTNARNSVSGNPAVTAYLIQSMLAGYKNKLDGLQKFTGGTLNHNDINAVTGLLQELDCAFAGYLMGDDLKVARIQVMYQWKRAFGLMGKNVVCSD